MRWAEGLSQGRGFASAVALALGEGDTIYAVNRGWEQVKNVPWNRTQLGTRVGKFTIGPVPGDEEVVADFSRPGDGAWGDDLARWHCAG